MHQRDVAEWNASGGEGGQLMSAQMFPHIADLKAADVMALFPDPKKYGGDEYQAIHAMLSGAMVNADDIEEVADLPFDFACSILREFERDIAMMREKLYEALKADRL